MTPSLAPARAGRRLALLALAVLSPITALAADSSAAGEPYRLAVRSYPSATQAVVSWASDAPAVYGFQVERRPASGGAWVQKGYVNDATRSFVDGGLVAGTSYEYRVIAFRPGSPAAGLPTADTVVLTPPAAGTGGYDAAAAPRDIDLQPLSGTDVMVSWSDQTPDESQFRIERRTGGGSWVAVGGNRPANSVRYRDIGLAPQTSYDYRITVDRPGLPSVVSATRSVTTPPASPRKVFFVDGCSGNNGNDGSEATPWATIQKAAYTLTAGQTVLVRNRYDCPSLYTSTPNASGKHPFAVVAIGNDAGAGQYANGGPRSGTPSAWITYRNYPGERPKIRTARGGSSPETNGNHHGISVRNAAYIVIEGFDVQGHLADVTQQEAADLNALYKSSPSTPISAVVDGSGITIGNSAIAPSDAAQIPHHIIVRNNKVYEHPGGGINGLTVDWMTVENNSVWNTSWYSPYGASPLNFYKPKDVDGDTTSYKLVLRGNRSTYSGNLFPCKCSQYTKQTDGNGIILDSFRSTTAPDLPAYAGRTLVENNVVSNHGARGIHSFSSSNIDIRFNTSYRNGIVPATADGEITVQNSRDVKVFNNIMVAYSDRPMFLIAFKDAAAKTADGATVVFDRNILFGGLAPAAATATTGALGPNNRVGLDPKFLATSGAYAFWLQGNSPALNTAWSGVPTPAIDAGGAPRPRGSAADVGAFEGF